MPKPNAFRTANAATIATSEVALTWAAKESQGSVYNEFIAMTGAFLCRAAMHSDDPYIFERLIDAAGAYFQVANPDASEAMLLAFKKHLGNAMGKAS